MASDVPVKETDQQPPPAAAAAAAATSVHNNQLVGRLPPAELAIDLDPQLLMAARRGDSNRLKQLLRMKEKEEEEDSMLLLDGVTLEGDTLLHVVAMCGDTQEFLDCANMIVAYNRKEEEGGAAASNNNKHRLQRLQARNNQGDTPLHRAAGAGNSDMISCLLHLANTDDDDDAVKAFLSMHNHCGETALHQAIRAPKMKNMPCIRKLMAVDPGLASLRIVPPGAGEEDDGGASPLYLAISLGQLDVASYLFRTCQGRLLSSYSGPNRRNVLHAAVSCGQAEALPMVLKWLKELKTSHNNRPEEGMANQRDENNNRQQHEWCGNSQAAALPMVLEDMRQEEGRGTGSSVVAADLLSQLTSQRDKMNGSTPLHLAASLYGLPSPVILNYGQWKLRLSSVRATTMLLDANESMAYQLDNGGLYPIHVAAGAGSLSVVMVLLKRCPECATLRDAKGRTFLHIAVEEGRYWVVRYVCRQSQPQRWVQMICYAAAAGLLSSILNARGRRQMMSSAAAVAGLLSSILNARDINGDAPLHRAVHDGDESIVKCLISNHQVRLDVPNKVGMRPIDVSWTTMPLVAYYAWDSRIHIRKLLLSVGAPYGENNRGDLFRQKHVRRHKQDEDDKKTSENLTAAAQVLALFSVLITTVTFASAFTLPGGNRSAGDGGGVAGTPLLAGPGRSYAFDAFILSDALAFGFSLLATSILLYAGVPAATLQARFMLINFAYGLLWHSGRSLVAGFVLGLYLVLSPVARTIAIAVALLMLLPASALFKESEGINSMGYISMIGIARSGVLGPVLYMLNHFWSYIIIFGLPAIRKWARLP